MPHQPSLRSPVGKPSAAAYLVALLTLVPASAAAQKDPFIDAFISFHSMLAGTYGDEGPKVVVALDQMAASLAAWEAANGKAETELNSRPTPAPADIALLYLDAGRRDAALTAIDSAIQAEPRRAAFHRLRGLILEAVSRDTDAVASLKTASDLDPDDQINAYLLVDRVSAGASPEDLQPQMAGLLGAYQRSGGAPAGRSARRPFMQLALIDDRAADTPMFSPAWYADGFSLLARGRYQDAIAQFRAALSRDLLVVDPAARSEPMARGIAELRQGRIAAAIEQLEAAVAAWPSSSEAHRILGAAYGANRNAAKSAEQLADAIRLAPGDERARVALGRALAEVGKMQEAERALRDTIAALPSSGQVRWALADLFEKSGRGIEAIRELEAAASLTVLAGKGRLYWRLADLSHQVQDYERVAVALSGRARLMPNEAGAHKDLGLAYHRLGRQDQALVELMMSSLLGLEDAETLAVIGQIHLTADRYTAAEDVLRRAVALKPESPEARYALGSTLLRLGKADEAKAHLAEFERLRAAALEDQRRTFELELLKREADRHTPEAGR
jgi:tetratricopeptide (TPR) repeat protein